MATRLVELGSTKTVAQLLTKTVVQLTEMLNEVDPTFKPTPKTLYRLYSGKVPYGIFTSPNAIADEYDLYRKEVVKGIKQGYLVIDNVIVKVKEVEEDFMENNLIEFGNHNLAIFQKMAELKKVQKELEKTESELKEALEKSMEEYGVKSFKNDYITISYVEETTSTSIDLKKLEAKEPDLYGDLLNDYPKITTKKAYVKFLVK